MMTRIKKIRKYGFLGLLLLSVCACSAAIDPKIEEDGRESIIDKRWANKKVLIAYLSRTNNTKAVAEMIQRSTGGKLFAIELETPYPADYRTTVDQVAAENRTGYLPPLKTKLDSMKQYDLLFLGFPTWGMQLPPPVKSFLKEYNLQGKTIIPFNTHAGYGMGSSLETIEQLCPESYIAEAFSCKGGVERDGKLFVMEGGREKEVAKEIQTWLAKIRLENE